MYKKIRRNRNKKKKKEKEGGYKFSKFRKGKCCPVKMFFIHR
jgi:hypothetical protein